MITIGVDFHKRTSSYCVLDESGKRIKCSKMENRPELIERFLENIPGPKKLAMEATRNWGLFYETVKPHVDEFLLGHPRKMKQITESETKHDRKDAESISQLAYGPFFPRAHAPSLDIRELRSLLRFRHSLVSQRKAIRNQVQILIDRNLWPCERPASFKDLFCLRGMKWLKALTLSPRERFILDQCLESHEAISQKIKALEGFIETQACELEYLKYLRQIPGFRKSRVNAYMVLLELDDIHRFRKARHFAHYAGLIPSEHSSGDKHRTGHLVRGANMFLRTALIESTFGALRVDRGLRVYYQSVKERRGSGSAIIACARKLSYAVYHVLKEKTHYQPFHPSATACPLASVPNRE